MSRTPLLAAALLALTAGAAGAQTLNMDMGWGIQRQMMLQQQGNAAAAAAAQAYYNHMLWLRMQGYTGPSLPTGVTPQTMMDANRRLQGAYDSYNRGWYDNSRRQSQAVENYGMEAIRGCTRVFDAYGQPHYFCP